MFLNASSNHFDDSTIVCYEDLSLVTYELSIEGVSSEWYKQPHSSILPLANEDNRIVCLVVTIR
jgi:hypothetical protein